MPTMPTYMPAHGTVSKIPGQTLDQMHNVVLGGGQDAPVTQCDNVPFEPVGPQGSAIVESPGLSCISGRLQRPSRT
jgi:hypothetical protein